MCIYNINTMKKENKELYSFRIHIQQLCYLRKMAKDNFTTVTQYLIDLINNDMKKNKYE